MIPGLQWDSAWRDATWARVDQPWDLIVIGGGIVGAGVLRAAAYAGLRALLLERVDFAWGASSRSTKLVHGGLRYLAHGQVGVARQLVTERERLLREVPGLVSPLAFLVPMYQGELGRRVAYQATMSVYDGLAGRTRHHRVSAADLTRLAPPLHRDRLAGGLCYFDAVTDDARLVLRTVREAVAAGALAVNAAEVTGLVRQRGRVVGVRVRDRLGGHEGELTAAVVVNATGWGADGLRSEVGGAPRMRPVRGSHLVFAGWRFPLAVGVVVRSPRDGRHISVVPWDGVTLVGTTDADHQGDPADEVAITGDEVSYLLECLAGPFRSLELGEQDVVSAWSGVRPLVSHGALLSPDERREHVVWDEQGLLTAAGSKLTTFGVIANDVLRAAAPHVPAMRVPPTSARSALAMADGADGRLVGRFGHEAAAVTALAGDADPIADTATTWAELRWSARCEGITSLEDLMLRRTRLGLVLAAGGAEILDDVQRACAPELGWDDARWQGERARYLRRIRDSYSIPLGTAG